MFLNRYVEVREADVSLQFAQHFHEVIKGFHKEDRGRQGQTCHMPG